MSPYVVVLGVAQDGGHPQPGCRLPCCVGPRGAVAHLPACLAIVNPATSQRWIIDATPALPAQLARLDAHQVAGAAAVDGVLLTHAHIGHYTGLVWLGREAMGARAVPVYVMPRMGGFLRANGPWRQLVELGNITLVEGPAVTLAPRLSVRAIEVPHRDEYSETVGWIVEGPHRRVLHLPDIDHWPATGPTLARLLSDVDAAWIDGTFWADGELARDMSEMPHPRVRETLALLGALPAATRARVRFTHLNHTNPLLDPDSTQAAAVRDAGAAVAWEGERFQL